MISFHLKRNMKYAWSMNIYLYVRQADIGHTCIQSQPIFFEDKKVSGNFQAISEHFQYDILFFLRVPWNKWCYYGLSTKKKSCKIIKQLDL